MTQDEIEKAVRRAFRDGHVITETKEFDGGTQIAVAVKIDVALRFPRDVTAEEITARFKQVIAE